MLEKLAMVHRFPALETFDPSFENWQHNNEILSTLQQQESEADFNEIFDFICLKFFAPDWLSQWWIPPFDPFTVDGGYDTWVAANDPDIVKFIDEINF